MTGRIVRINVSAGGVPKLTCAPTARVTWRAGNRRPEGTRPPHSRERHGGPERALWLFPVERIEALQAEGHPSRAGRARREPDDRGARLGRGGSRPTFFRPLARAERRRPDHAVHEPLPDRARPAFLDGAYARVSEQRHPGVEPRLRAGAPSRGDRGRAIRVERWRLAEGASMPPSALERGRVTIVDPRRSPDPAARPLEDGRPSSRSSRTRRTCSPSSRLDAGHGFTHWVTGSATHPRRHAGGSHADRDLGRRGRGDLTHIGANTAIESPDLETRDSTCAGATLPSCGPTGLLRSRETLAFWTEAPWNESLGLSMARPGGIKAVGYDYPPDYHHPGARSCYRPPAARDRAGVRPRTTPLPRGHRRHRVPG